MNELKNLKIGQPVFWKNRLEFGYYIGYWSEIGKVVYAYHLFSMIRYNHITASGFKNEFLVDKNEIRLYLENRIKEEKEKRFVSIPDKVYRKLENQEWQLECMKKLNKPLEELKKGERNIKRQLKKIKRYNERNEEMESQVDYDYIGIWEQFENFFGE